MFFFVLLCVSKAALGIEENGVLVLKKSNFENRLNEHYQDGILVLHYAEWCGHCKEYLPKFEEFAKSSSIIFGKIADEDVAREKKIESYPSLRFYRKGLETTVKVGEDLAAAAVRLSADRVVSLSDLKQAFELSSGVRVVSFTKKITKVAQNFIYPIEFFLASPKLRAEAERLAGTPAGSSIIMLRPYDGNVATNYSKHLKKWLEKEMMPVVVPFLPDFVDLIFKGPLRIHLVFAASGDDQYLDTFYQVAKANHGKLLHILLMQDTAEEVWDFLRIESAPALVVSDMTTENEKGEQTLYEGNLGNATEILEFSEPFVARHAAKKAGIDAKTAEIMSDPKLRRMLRDPKMETMFTRVMGMPQKLIDIYKNDELYFFSWRCGEGDMLSIHAWSTIADHS